ncbi:MAG: hypothetical protein AAB476_00995 [Patescibacteria group bacterium]
MSPITCQPSPYWEQDPVEVVVVVVVDPLGGVQPVTGESAPVQD